MSDLYRLIYTSRSVTDEECPLAETMSDILASSRRNNGRQGVTGVILVDGRTFAQVLEGPRQAVEATFERIRRDTRHDAISVLRGEITAVRTFAGWEMGCVGPSERGATLLKTLSRQPTRTFSLGEGDRFCATLLAILRASEEGSTSPRPEVRDAMRDRGARALQSGSDAGPVTASAGSGLAAADPQATVLRGFLDEERERTTALRRELDDARVAVAQVRSAVEDTERHRDIWADRGRQMRAQLREAGHALQTARSRCDDLQNRLAACEAERDRLRVHRDIWADRTRSLARALCRDPAPEGEDAGSLAVREMPAFGVVAS